ncbi:hypothetical protein MRX96_013660 [Rhipicephalus microplus]
MAYSGAGSGFLVMPLDLGAFSRINLRQPPSSCRCEPAGRPFLPGGRCCILRPIPPLAALTRIRAEPGQQHAADEEQHARHVSHGFVQPRTGTRCWRLKGRPGAGGVTN